MRDSEVEIARRAFLAAKREPSYLSSDVLEAMDATYPPKPPVAPLGTQPYTAGDRRAVEMLNVLTKLGPSKRLLDLGAGEAMLSLSLQKSGHRLFAIDTKNNFDRRAWQSGVQCQVMNAAQLTFPDNFFDLVFSIDAFEHVEDPQAALHQSIRVVRPGGYIYLDFGPLFNSAQGLHSHRVIHVPYRQYLFSRDVLHQFAASRNRGRIHYQHVNQWSLFRFRTLFQDVLDQVECTRYTENLDTRFVDLIQKYPSCFRCQVDDFDELIAARIFAVLQKKFA